MHIAHRGIGAENTLRAFECAARRLGAFECDVRWSADDIPVIIHDCTLARTHGVHRRVNACDAKTLDTYRVPRLETVLNAFDGTVTIVLDLKEDPRAVIRWLERRGRVEPHVVLLVWEDGVRVPTRWTSWRVRYYRFPTDARGHDGIACRFNGSGVNRACIKRALDAGLHVNMYATTAANARRMRRTYAHTPNCSFTVKE